VGWLLLKGNNLVVIYYISASENWLDVFAFIGRGLIRGGTTLPQKINNGQNKLYHNP